MNKRANEVLLVDDDDAVRKMMQRVLTRAGMNVESVATATAALAILRGGKRFEAIVTDLMMPEIDGMQLLRFVRQLDLDVPMITERASLHRIDDLKGKIRALRDMGFRIAVDDLGAGYSGLSTFGQLDPDIVKLDMSLIRGIDGSTAKASLVRSMIAVCSRDLGVRVVCEGVETVGERDALERVGADLLQGYLFAKPENTFRDASIFAPALV